MAIKKFTEEELERFVLSPEQWSEEQREAIEDFIRENALAQDYVLSVVRFRDEMQTREAQGPSTVDERIAGNSIRSLGKVLPGRTEGSKELFSGEDTSGWLSVYQWGAVIRKHPVRTFAATSILAAALISAVIFVKPSIDENPSYAESKENKLIVYNTQGEVLFTKSAPGIPSFSVGGEQYNQFTRPFLIADIDGNGVNDVLTNTYNKANALSSGGLICFNANGQEIWRFSAKVDLSRIDQGVQKATRNEVFDFLVMRGNGKRPPRIFVVIADPTFSASSVVEVDFRTGKTLQQYWHTGGINKIIECDVNRDGRSEILIAGINDQVEMVFAAGLDPDAMDGGTSTSYSGFFNGDTAREVFYMVFPPTSFYSKHAYVKFNTLWSLRSMSVNNQSFEVQTNEIPPKLSGEVGGGIHYIVNSKLEVSSIGLSSPFEKIYNEYRANKDTVIPPLDQKYIDEQRTNVRWWNGSEFIAQPTMVRVRELNP